MSFLNRNVGYQPFYNENNITLPRGTTIIQSPQKNIVLPVQQQVQLPVHQLPIQQVPQVQVPIQVQQQTNLQVHGQKLLNQSQTGLNLSQTNHQDKQDQHDHHNHHNHHNHRKEEYDSLMIPPSFEQAHIHQQASSIKKNPHEGQHADKCICCNEFVHGEHVPYITIKDEQLSFLGSGVPLFFQFIKFGIILLLILFVCQGIINIVFISKGSSCNISRALLTPLQAKQTKGCFDFSFNKYTLANIDLSNISYTNGANLLTIIILMGSMFIIRYKQRQRERELDNAEITCKDYAIHIQDIPDLGQYFDYKSLLTQHLKQNTLQVNGDLILHDIILIQDTNEYYSKLNEIKNTVYDKKNIILNLRELFSVDLQQKLNQTNQKIEELKKDAINIAHQQKDQLTLFANEAIVIFETTFQRNQVINQLQNKQDSKLLKTLRVDGQEYNLKIIEPAEPSDFFWQNIRANKDQKFKRSIFVQALTMLVILVVFGISLALSNYLKAIKQKMLTTPEDEQELKYKIKNFILIYSFSFTTMIFNFFLVEFIYFQAKFLLLSTKTIQNIDISEKGSYAKFLNSTVLYIILAELSQNYYDVNGLSESVLSLVTMGAILPIVVKLLYPHKLWKLFLQYEENKLGSNSVKTQQELNYLMEGIEFRIAYSYSTILSTLYISFFYASFMPIVSVFAIAQLVQYYFLVKWGLVHSSRKPPQIGDQLSREMVENLEYTIIFFAAGNFLFNYKIDPSNIQGYLDEVGLVLSFIYTALPLFEWNKKIFPLTYEELDDDPRYDEASKHFQTDYYQEYPPTKSHHDFNYVNL